MANTVISPVMSMPVPVPGTDPGPQYAFDLNSCLNILDQHDHTPGAGNPITPSAMSINADLTIGSHNLTALRSTRFTAQGAPLALASDLGCVYVSGVDLYYNDENGNQIRLTASGGIAGTPGSISNLVAPASAAYVAGSKTFVFQSDVNQAANIDGGSYILRNIPGTFGLTLSPPTLGSNYTITLPTLPGVSSFLSIDSSGSMGDSIPLMQGIDTANIANNAITTPLINNLAVTTAKIADAAVTTVKIEDGAVTLAKQAATILAQSASSGTFTTTSSSQVDVVSINFTSTGRLIRVEIVGASGSSPCFLSVTDASNPAIGRIYITQNSSDLQMSEVSTNIVGSSLLVPFSTYVIANPGPGTFNFKIRANVVSSPTTVFTIQNMRIQCYEI